MYDWLIVGAGFAGSVLAERIASQRQERVLVVDRRSHIGGNAYDRRDAAGLLIHQYGPHIFHTNSERIFEYLSRFTEWRPYEHRVLAMVDGQLLPIPINLDTVNRLYGLDLDSDGLEQFFQSRAEHVEQVRRQGWASNIGETEEGLNSIAVPVFDTAGRCLAAISVAGPAYRMTPERLAGVAAQSLRSAQDLTNRLQAQ